MRTPFHPPESRSRELPGAALKGLAIGIILSLPLWLAIVAFCCLL